MDVIFFAKIVKKATISNVVEQYCMLLKKYRKKILA